jgi:hypothetical protein
MSNSEASSVPASDEQTCVSCRRPKANIHCGLCESSVCKKCSQNLEPETFAFLETLPPELAHLSYCQPCFDEKVAPALDSYNETMEQAKAVYVFFTSQKKEIPLIKKSKETLTIKDRPDRDEVIFRLGFMAAAQSYNAIIEVNVTSEKHQHGKHQKSIWRGTAIPALIDGDKMDRRDSFR